ncbi:hypothetical protein HMPREF0476_1635 [Kingella kingae ATCC 23330]|uniref:Uncharacterized protein n=1 Tax=Kingella kingae ATCC 23330 TaxID=887327 RepID=F5S8V2_KINKI|nr:hypothetical protein HMPREF0476_1635 [Kingella kingae ATCC 23330]
MQAAFESLKKQPALIFYIVDLNKNETRRQRPPCTISTLATQYRCHFNQLLI